MVLLVTLLQTLTGAGRLCAPLSPARRRPGCFPCSQLWYDQSSGVHRKLEAESRWTRESNRGLRRGWTKFRFLVQLASQQDETTPTREDAARWPDNKVPQWVRSLLRVLEQAGETPESQQHLRKRSGVLTRADARRQTQRALLETTGAMWSRTRSTRWCLRMRRPAGTTSGRLRIWRAVQPLRASPTCALYSKSLVNCLLRRTRSERTRKMKMQKTTMTSTRLEPGVRGRDRRGGMGAARGAARDGGSS